MQVEDQRYLREAYGPIRRKEERSKATRLELREIPSWRGDDALMVAQGLFSSIDIYTLFSYIFPLKNQNSLIQFMRLSYEK
jgi:hypothetical protein